MDLVTPDLSIVIFAATLLGTFVASYLGRRHAWKLSPEDLSAQKLNKWLVGLSAGAAANSGFVVTGAVGLGYAGGARWLVLPLAWLLGDIVFWTLFPARLNRVGAATKAATLTDLVVSGLRPGAIRALKILIAAIVLICLSGYVSAQWVAGEKFLRGAFGFGSATSLLSFAGLIVLYSSIGGFRGSVYADSFQAVLRVMGTAIALGAVIVTARADPPLFWSNIAAAGPDFVHPFAGSSLFAGVGFVLGFAAASLGFGLAQPHMVTRYLAGASPSETRAAWWVYMGFVQFTWIAMTIFGMVLRGVLPAIADAESGLSIFFRSATGPALTGIIAADIFATIAAASNSLLVAMSQTLRFDLLRGLRASWVRDAPEWAITAAIGAITMALSLALHSSVVNLALSSTSLMAAGLAPAVAVRVLGWRHSGLSLVLSVLVGVAVATVWRASGLAALINEAAPGMLAALMVNIGFATRSSVSREFAKEKLGVARKEA